MDNLRTFVHLVAWNSMAFLPEFMKSLEAQTVPARLTVVDNASMDGVASWFTQNFPTVTILRNMRNVGFAKAHNQAMQLTLSGQNDVDLDHVYIIVCNPDIVLARDFIAKIENFMDQHPEYDACAPKILRANLRTDEGGGEPELTDVIDAMGLKMYKSCRAIDAGAGTLDRREHMEAKEIFGVGGTLSCFRASSVKKIWATGEFYDEDFFAYQEDIDLTWRMRRMGMKSAVVPLAVAWHHRTAKSSESRNWLRIFLARRHKAKHVNYLSTRNHCWLLAKNLTWGDVFLLAPWLWTYEIAKLIAALASWTSVKAYAAAFYGLPKILKKRGSVFGAARIAPAETRKTLV